MKKAEAQVRKATEQSRRIESQIGQCKAIRSKYERDQADLTRAVRKVCAKQGWEANDNDQGESNFETRKTFLSRIFISFT